MKTLVLWNHLRNSVFNGIRVHSCPFVVSNGYLMVNVLDFMSAQIGN